MLDRDEEIRTLREAEWLDWAPHQVRKPEPEKKAEPGEKVETWRDRPALL